MTQDHSPQLSKAELKHREIVERYPLYRETAHWIPVIVPRHLLEEAIVKWLADRNLKRGTKEARNDYLVPLTGFFLFKDPRVATEFKLTWG